MTGDYKFDTLSLHAGFTPDERHGSAAVPIHQTTSYVFKDSEHAAALYNLEIGGHLYSRISNPTVAVLEQLSVALFLCDTLAWHEQLEFVMILFALALVFVVQQLVFHPHALAH